jgi:hypothetical protein
MSAVQKEVRTFPRHTLKKLVLLMILFIVPMAALAEEAPERPHWSFELKGGEFIPDVDNWSAFYGQRYTSEYGGSVAYKITRKLEFGIEGMYLKDNGQGFAPIHQTITGNVKYASAPLNVFVLVRGLFSEKQWLVPYVGGGWTTMFYREEVQSQEVTRGSTNGYHGRAGLQLLLDGIDPSASTSMYLDYGMFHTYLFVEAEYIRAMANTSTSGSVNLGGTSWLAGLLFEF